MTQQSPLADGRTALVAFLVVGGVSVVVDTGVLVLAHDVLDLRLAVATTLAFAVSLGVNFTLNMLVVFGARGRVGRRLVRYLVLVCANYVLTLVLVLGLAALDLHYVAAKLVAVLVCAALNFVAYQRWVFAP